MGVANRREIWDIRIDGAVIERRVGNIDAEQLGIHSRVAARVNDDLCAHRTSIC